MNEYRKEIEKLKKDERTIPATKTTSIKRAILNAFCYATFIFALLLFVSWLSVGRVYKEFIEIAGIISGCCFLIAISAFANKDKINDFYIKHRDLLNILFGVIIIPDNKHNQGQKRRQ
jgi:hypothetical protein